MKKNKIIDVMQKELTELKKIIEENRELNELLKAQALANEQMLMSFNKKIPKGMFT